MVRVIGERGWSRLGCATVALVVATAVAGLWTPSRAEAAVSCGAPVKDHCYAIAEWAKTARGYEGESASITPECLYSSRSGGGNFVSQELWEGTDNEGKPRNAWLEEGVMAHPKPEWFWVNHRPGERGILTVYVPRLRIRLGSTYLLLIQYQGHNQWDINARPANGDQWSRLVLHNPPYTHWLEAGSEYTAGRDRDRGVASSLMYERQNGSFGDWYGAGATALGPHHYVSAKMVNGHRVSWSTSC